MHALLVDELSSMRHFLAMCLAEFTGLHVDQAEDGGHALRMLEHIPYALVVLDLNLPEGDGFALLEHLRDRRGPGGQPAAIAICTQSDPEVRRRVESLGAEQLRRPVRAAELRQMARRLLGLPEPEPEAAAADVKLPIPTLRARFSGRKFVAFDARDANALGAFLVAEQLAPVGSVGTARLEFAAEPDAFDVPCRVVHTRPQDAGPDRPRGFAVRFEPADPELSARLARAFVPPAAQIPQWRLLGRLPLFRGLDDDELQAIEDLIIDTEVDADDVVVEEGEPSDAFYIVKTGAVKIVKGRAQAAPQELAVLRDGDFFGEMGVVMGAPRSASVIAMVPTELYRIDRNDLIGLIRGHANLAEKIQAIMIRRYTNTLAAIFATKQRT